ncbi:MAG: AraC family transcriptional regulator [Bacteroidota bacterium]
MFPTFNLYSIPLLLLTLQGLVFAVLLLQRYLRSKQTSDLLLLVILLITCYHQTSYTIGFLSWYDTYRNTKINYFLIDLSLLLAPLIYFYFRTITNPKRSVSKRDLLHFIPIAIVLILRAAIFIYDANQEGFEAVQNGYLFEHFLMKYFNPIGQLLSAFQMVVYLVLAFQLLYNYQERIKNFFSNTFKLELNWLKTFLLIYSILFLYRNIEGVIDTQIIHLSWIQEWWYYLLSGIAIIYIGIRGYFTDLSELKGIEIKNFLNAENEVPQASPKLENLKQQLASFFAENKPYLEQELNLVKLSQKLQLSREEVSEVINKGFGVKFNDYVNRYRIEEFKHRIATKDHERLSLLGLAYECGFNSKATFNRAFKKVTTVSPSEYLKSISL